MERTTENLRIAFTGRGGTGKTSLSHEIARRLELPHIYEVVRQMAKRMGLKDINDLSETDRVVLQTSIAMRQQFLEGLHQTTGFVSDRSLYDARVYTEILVPGGVTEAYLQLTEPQGYDYIIYVPPFSKEIEDDGFRLESNILEATADAMMKTAVKRMHYLCATDFQDRVDEILSLVQKSV